MGAWIIDGMSDETPQAPQTPETPETPTDTFPPVQPATVEPAPAADHKPSKLNKVLAWVGIAAGSVFIVAVIFFSGYFMGLHAGHHHGMHKHRGHGHDSSQFRDRDDRQGPPPGMWRPAFPGGPGFFFPGGPGGPGGQPAGPGAPGGQPVPAQPGR